MAIGTLVKSSLSSEDLHVKFPTAGGLEGGTQMLGSSLPIVNVVA